MLTHKRLTERLEYDPNTGLFVWKYRNPSDFKNTLRCASWNSKHCGEIAGRKVKTKTEYISIGIDYKTYLAHRLAWFYVYETWPNKTLDHIDTIRSHNWITNLREATYGENNQNIRVAMKRNLSGYLGVCTDNGGTTFRAKIQVNGKSHYLGSFKNPEDAHAVYLIAKRV
jgi:hypothetical protein